MKTHYLKIALRNMRRFRLQTIVCLTGLAVGMTCFALGTLWLRYIESFEDFVPDGDNIYLVMHGSGKNLFSSGCFYYTDVAKGEQLREHVPGVTESCFLAYMPTYNIEHGLTAGDKELAVSAAIADSAYIRMFGIEAVEGSLQRFCDGDIAITRSLAQRVFGHETAIGREVMLEAVPGAEKTPFSVVAVIDDRPLNSQFRYDLLACCDAVGHPAPQADGQSSYKYVANACNFVKFAPSVPRDSIVGTHRMAFINEHGRDTVQYTFAPLTQIRTDFISDNVMISTSYVRWFILLGLLVILCSLANYVITMVSHLRRRGWEMSLRRVLGSSRVHILYMVSVETMLTMLLAAALACILTVLVLPFFREYSGIDIAWSAMAQRLAAYLVMVIVGGMALSSLTAWIVMRRVAPLLAPPRGRVFCILTRSAHHPPGGGRGEGGGCGVILQMALSMAIIFCAVVMLRQVRMLMYSDELGFCHTDRAVVNEPNETLKQKLCQSPLVVDMLEDATIVFPRRRLSTEALTTDESQRDDWQAITRMYKCHIDSAVFNFYSMSLVTGELPTFGREEVVLNESACALLGLTAENAVGTTVYRRDRVFTVSGVMRDAYQVGAVVNPDPMAYYPTDKWPADGTFVRRGSHIALRTQPGRVKELCDSINAWKEQMDLDEPDFIGMQVENCEEEFEQYIASEQMLIKILFTVGGASLFVCVIGTFSLISLSLQQRRKEIAIRKVHGAKTTDILRLFMRSHVVSLFVAALVAYPIAYIIMRRWLEGYQKQVAIDWWLIPATFVIIAAVVMTTVSVKIWRAAKDSTVEALK